MHNTYVTLFLEFPQFLIMLKDPGAKRSLSRSPSPTSRKKRCNKDKINYITCPIASCSREYPSHVEMLGHFLNQRHGLRVDRTYKYKGSKRQYILYRQPDHFCFVCPCDNSTLYASAEELAEHLQKIALAQGDVGRDHGQKKYLKTKPPPTMTQDFWRRNCGGEEVD